VLRLVDPAFMRHVAYAVREQLLPRLSPYSRAHGEYRAGHDAEESTAEAHYRAGHGRSQAHSVSRRFAKSCERKEDTVLIVETAIV